MVQEVAQILLHILALLGFAESWYSAEAVARAECPAVTMWVPSVPTLFQSTSAVTVSGVTAEECSGEGMAGHQQGKYQTMLEKVKCQSSYKSI